MSGLQIHQFFCRSDNFGVLLHDPASGATASIDAPDEAAIRAALTQTGWQLTDILVTHHHFDHVEGIPGLKASFNPRIVGPRTEAAKIPGIDLAVGEGDSFDFAGRRVDVLDTPGHTLGHIALVFADEGLVFAGDTLFALGCGRILEGTAEQMWASLEKLAALDPDTKVYCGHEYTLANGRFALSVDGANATLIAKMADYQALRSEGKATLPTTIGLERATNPFLRAGAPEFKAALGMADATDVAVFARLRQMKNDFKG